MTPVEQQDPPRRTRMPAAQRRESILDAAAGVFAAAGYRAAKVSDIADRVGVSEPVVFQNFGSKAALFTAVLERAAAQASASVDHAAARLGSAGALLAQVIGHATGGPRPDARAGPAAGHHAPGAAPGALFAAAVALAADPAVPELRDTILRTLAGHLADIVRRGQQDGSVRADLGPEPAAWLLVSLLASGPLRAAAMPAGLEPAIAGLVGCLLSPVPDRGQGRPGSGGERHTGGSGGLIGVKRGRVSVGSRGGGRRRTRCE
jgi:AcrR family transcriptional regulator